MIKMDEIAEGMLVVGKWNDDYEGLVGFIDEVRRDANERETQNETKLELVIDFYETSDLSISHSHLNGTSVDQLFLGEDELVFFPNGTDGPGFDMEGNEYVFEDCVYSKLYNEMLRDQL